MPVRRRSECTTTASRSSAVSSPGPALDLGVAEAVEGQGRLEDVVAAAEDEPVGRLGRRAAAGRRARRARAPRRAGAVISRPAWPRHAEPQPADEVLPEVDQRRARTARSRSLRGAASRDGARAARRTAPGARVEVEDLRRARRPGRVGAGPQPRRRRAAGRRWSGRRRGRRRWSSDGPAVQVVVGDDDLPVAVGEDDLQLGDQRRAGRRTARAGRSRPSRPRYHPLPSARPSTRARASSVGDVVAAVAQPPLVAAPARG